MGASLLAMAKFIYQAIEGYVTYRQIEKSLIASCWDKF